jgi:serine/threonine protein kinase
MASGVQLAAPHVMQSTEIHPGDILAGKYRVRAILGRNHGLLVDAFHTEFDQRVVIKTLLPGSGDTKEIERFRREARTLAKLSSEHTARIIDVGSEADGSFYLVREYLEGTDLGRYIRKNGPLALADAVLLILQAAEAIAETHSHGIIVREVQPSTLFLTQRPGGGPLVKLIDFGTAKLMSAASAPGAGAELTATAMFGLSPYSSPEMIRKAKGADARTDVWSLGAILYELLTGRAPFIGEAAMLMLQITREDPTPPSHLSPHLPPEIDQIISWALAKDVDARFKNVYAFAHALRPFATSEGQILVDRIGQITEQAKRRPKPASLPPPAAPPGRPSSSVAPPARGSSPAAMPRNQNDSFTREYAPPGRGSSDNGVDSIEDTTTRVPPGFGGPNASATAVATLPPPAMPAAPGSQPAFPSSPPPSGFASAVASVPPGRGSQPGYSSPDLQASSPATGQPAPVRPKGLLDRRLVVGVLAAGAVLLPALIAIVIMSRSRGPEATTSPTAPISVPVPPANTAAVAVPVPLPVATMTAPPAVSAEPAVPATATGPAAPATSDPLALNPKKNVTSSGGGGGTTVPKPVPTPDPPKTTVKPVVDPPPAGGGDKGTLVAIAMGGTCAFSVNGSSKGSGSSIKVQLAPGNYSVMCKPPGGALKSKTITVKSGGTAMATFKL